MQQRASFQVEQAVLLWLSGLESCRSARICGPNKLYALGQKALKSAVINTCFEDNCDKDPAAMLRDIQVFGYGHKALNSATLRCVCIVCVCIKYLFVLFVPRTQTWP